ncbi:MAG: hypothetical protein EOO04_17620 [Chitinophagaceae bacterium]|nr:MAG: hypothetical protein EOO04_17620 [Chitinophagaceae bacterium]
MIVRYTSLSKNIVQFCRYLRHHGFSISVEEESTALNALQFIDFTNATVFRLALKAILCRSRIELEKYDNLFNEYWKELDKAVESKIKDDVKPVHTIKTKAAPFKSLQSWLTGNKNKENEVN